MSIVCNVVCRQGSWIVSDQRGISDGKIVSENVCKAKMINQNVCVGYTGVLEVAQAVLNRFLTNENRSAIARLRSDETADLIGEILKKSLITTDGKTTFLVSGKNKDERIASYIIEQNGKVMPRIPSEEEQFIATSIGSTVDTKLLCSMISSEIETRGMSNIAIVSAMEKYVCKISESDSHVNKNTSVIEIKL